MTAIVFPPGGSGR